MSHTTEIWNPHTMLERSPLDRPTVSGAFKGRSRRALSTESPAWNLDHFEVSEIVSQWALEVISTPPKLIEFVVLFNEIK